MGNQPAYRVEELQGWLESLELDDEIEPCEKQLLYTPAGDLSQQDTLDGVWRLEGLGILAWALGVMPLPGYDELIDADTHLNKLGLLNVQKARSFMKDARLRDNRDIEGLREQIFALNWRMVDYRVHPRRVDFANVNICGRQLDTSWALLKKGDLVIQGSAIGKANADLLGTMNSLARERHHAVNWLCGYDPLYSQISTDT